MKSFIEQLVEIRTQPRKMRADYLAQHGLLDEINKQVPNEFKLKEKIDVIIKGTYDKCYCGNLAKPTSSWCSITCMNKDTERNAIISQKQKQNKTTRAAAMRKTLLERYGVTSTQAIPSAQAKTKAKKQSYYDEVVRNTFQSYNLDYDKLSDHKVLKELCVDKSYQTLSKMFFNDMPVMTIFRHFERIKFDPGFVLSSSAGERDLANYVESLGVSVIRNDRTIIKPKELDVVVPDKNIAFEFNGLYWHSGDKNKHIEKKTLAAGAGYKLIQFFEDEWYEKRELCQSIIRSKLKLADKIYARQTDIRLVESKQAREFLERTHIQGFVAGKHYGLFHKDELVCIMSVGKNRFFAGVELLRFSSELNTNIIGGFSKLLKTVKNDYGCPIFSYADLRFSDGDVYEQFGKYVRTTQPGYFWVKGSSCKRYNRYQTMKHKLEKFLGSKFDPDKSERENMTDAGYAMIYDCGHKLYEL